MTESQRCGICNGVKEHPEMLDQGHVSYLCADTFHDTPKTEGDDTLAEKAAGMYRAALSGLKGDPPAKELPQNDFDKAIGPQWERDYDANQGRKPSSNTALELLTGAASEDVPKHCPTCKSEWMDKRFDVGEGELRYACPDWWHSEAYREGIKKGRARSDARVHKAVTRTRKDDCAALEDLRQELLALSLTYRRGSSAALRLLCDAAALARGVAAIRKGTP